MPMLASELKPADPILIFLALCTVSFVGALPLCHKVASDGSNKFFLGVVAVVEVELLVIVGEPCKVIVPHAVELVSFCATAADLSAVVALFCTVPPDMVVLPSANTAPPSAALFSLISEPEMVSAAYALSVYMAPPAAPLFVAWFLDMVPPLMETEPCALELPPRRYMAPPRKVAVFSEIVPPVMETVPVSFVLSPTDMAPPILDAFLDISPPFMVNSPSPNKSKPAP